MNDAPALPTTSWQFWGFLAFLVYQAVLATLNHLQNRKSLTNQADMKQQLNGNTERVAEVHEALGLEKGKNEGAATEQARVATQTALATQEAIRLSGDEMPVYKGPGK
jgi:hypothetical protein